MNDDCVIIDGRKLNVFAAITDDEQSLGLMYKKWPPQPTVFPYKKASVVKFWMKNTPSPLDIIFCYASKVRHIYYGEPLGTDEIGPDEKIDFVLELPFGWAEKYNVRVGSDIKLELSIASKIKQFEKLAAQA